MLTQLSFCQEEKMFHPNQICPGVFHIADEMGVCFTLIEGSDRAVLFDTGYGTENVSDYVGTLTSKPVSVILSHGHHDHMLGARWFEKTYLCREDLDEFHERTGVFQRTKVSRQAHERGVQLPDDFMEAAIPVPEAIRFTDTIAGFESLTEDLGGMEIQVIHVPGHTPGSAVIHVPAYDLLLTGDDWNPCTWMWFPTSMNADGWRDNMRMLINALEQVSGSGIGRVLCSHQPMLRTGEELKSFLAYMTDERLKAAPPVDMGAPIDTHQIVKDEWTLVFDQSKINT